MSRSQGDVHQQMGVIPWSRSTLDATRSLGDVGRDPASYVIGVDRHSGD